MGASDPGALPAGGQSVSGLLLSGLRHPAAQRLPQPQVGPVSDWLKDQSISRDWSAAAGSDAAPCGARLDRLNSDWIKTVMIFCQPMDG